MTDGFGDATVYRAGTTTFRVLSDNAALLELLDDLWRHCRTSQRAIHTLELVSTPNGYLVGVDGVVTVTGVPDETVLSRMVWEVNALVRGAPSAALLVHAGVVQLGQVGVLVCGASGAGGRRARGSAARPGRRP